MSILLVHDDPDILDWLTTLLEANGFEVAIGATAFAARAKIERSEVGAILAALDVGGGAGHALIEWATANRPALLERFLVLSESAADEAIAQAHDLTAIGPTEYGSILSWVSEVLAAGPPTPVARFEAEASRPPNLLLIEDDSHQARFISDILRGYGFAIHFCENIELAKARLTDSSAAPIDLILSDWYLGETSGAVLYEWLLVNDADLVDRTIFISGGSMRDIRQEAPLASCYPKGQDSRVLVAALTRAARAALRADQPR